MTKPRTDLTAEYVRSILDYDPLTGIFRWKYRASNPPEWNTKHEGKPAGSLSNGYITIRLPNGFLYPAHRLAWLYVKGVWPANIIDHKNGVGNENWFDNLREATQAENTLNRRKQSNNTTGYVGVRFRKHHGKWEGRINLSGKTVWRGYFDSAQEAAAVRRSVLAQYHGEFAKDH
jgi:hypothetical protein